MKDDTGDTREGPAEARNRYLSWLTAIGSTAVIVGILVFFSSQRDTQVWIEGVQQATVSHPQQWFGIALIAVGIAVFVGNLFFCAWRFESRRQGVQLIAAPAHHSDEV